MYKRLVAAGFLLAGTYSASTQTLFTYGKETVTVPEFMKAYNKNKAATEKAGNYALNDYLDLYISSRLKVAEAKALGYDTLPQMVVDLQNLRDQIIPAYLNDDAAVSRLVDEAFIRQQKDIRLAHIFIAVNKNGLVDEAGAKKRADEAYSKLGKGQAFAAVAKEYSDDPSVSGNGGDIGYITVFSLPYELENLAYKTPVGQTSALYRSKAGYHIFKNLGERKALGKLKVAQILIATPPESTVAEKGAAKKLADSIYARLLKGDDFGKLATSFSNDVVSAASAGAVPAFGVGEYDPLFESQALTLKPFQISKPFSTAHGWHIVKRLGRTPVSLEKGDSEAAQALRSKVEGSDRINTAKAAMAKRIMQEVGFKKASFEPNALWAYSDSVLDFKKGAYPQAITAETILITIGDKSLTALDWITYARSFRYKADGSGLKPYPQVWEEYEQSAAMDYYKVNLERYNPEFKAQVAEFKEGNLFFEIMQRQVWGPAGADTVALETYYNRNKEKYNWKPSADAVVFYAGDAGTANAALKTLKGAPARWREVVGSYEDKLAVDSNRFELEALPNPTKIALKPGTLTAALVNPSDNTASFAYIIKLYPTATPRSFAEAKGLVMNDYQTELETRWVNTLRAKYPVTINQPVLLELLK